MEYNKLFELPKETGIYTSDSTQDVCYHPEHNPPMHLSIPRGYGYRHKCPRCGNVMIIKNEEHTFRM